MQKTGGNGVDLSYIQQTGDTSYINDGGDRYTGLDRFGRVIDQYWSPVSSPTSPTDRFQMAYDEGSDVLYKNNLVSSSNSELYHSNSTASGDDQTGYDPLARLTNFERGTLSASGNNGSSGLGSLDTVGTVVHSQSWNLDDEGNWSSFTSDATTQTRTNNTDNQITSISGATTPTYDNNGNTTKDERGYAFTFDAWSRPVVAKNAGGTTIADYGYDANGWRIADSIAGQDRYFNVGGQEIEDRNSSGVVTGQLVWSADGGVNHLVLRDDSSTSGSLGATSSGLGERLYVQQDANGDVTALTNTSGAVQERFIYDPYGARTVLTASWVGTSDSYNWDYGFQGGHLEIATGVYRFGLRDYSATLGQWLEEDPIGYMDGTNLYNVEHSNPADGSDPLGLSDWRFGGILPPQPMDPTDRWGSADPANYAKQHVTLNGDFPIPNGNVHIGMDIGPLVVAGPNGTRRGSDGKLYSVNFMADTVINWIAEYMVQTGGPMGAAVLLHYASNSGTNLQLSVDQMIRESAQMRDGMQSDINAGMAFIESADRGGTVSERAWNFRDVNDSKNWLYAFRGYNDIGWATVLRRGTGCYSMTFHYIISKWYNFDRGESFMGMHFDWLADLQALNDLARIV